MSRRRGHAELITWVVQRKPLSRNKTDKATPRCWHCSLSEQAWSCGSHPAQRCESCTHW
jgi:hypothetical protein